MATRKRIRRFTWDLKYFEPYELLSPDGLRLLSQMGICCIDPEFLNALDSFREYLGKPLLCNKPGLFYRGWRSPEEFINHTKKPNQIWSYHLIGAGDLDCPELTSIELYDALDQFIEGEGGLILYDWGVHFDFGLRLIPYRAGRQKFELRSN